MSVYVTRTHPGRRLTPLILFVIAGVAMGCVMTGLVTAVALAEMTTGQAVIAGVIPFSAIIALTFFAARLSMTDERNASGHEQLAVQVVAIGQAVREELRRQFPHLVEIEDRLRDVDQVHRSEMKRVREELAGIRHAIAGDDPEVVFKRLERVEAERDQLFGLVTEMARADAERAAGGSPIPQQRMEEAVDLAIRGVLEEMAADRPGVVDLEPFRALDRIRTRLRDQES